MQADFLATGTALFTALFCLLLAVVTLVRPSHRQKREGWLVIFLLISGVWQLTEVVLDMGGLASWSAALTDAVPLLVIASLTLLLFFLGRGLLQIKRATPLWLAAGAGWLLLLAAVVAGLLPLPNLSFTLFGRARQISSALPPLLAGWLLFNAAGFFFAREGHAASRLKPLFRNRVRFWALTLVVALARDFIILNHSPLLATLFHLQVVTLLVYTFYGHRLLDIKAVLRRAVSYLIVIIILGTVIILTAQPIYRLLQAIPGNNPVVDSAALATLLIIVLNPLVWLINRIIDRLAGQQQHDAGRTLQKYSQSIGNIVHMRDLEAAAIQHISEAMGVTYGRLLLVDPVPAPAGGLDYRVSSLPGFGDEKQRVVNLAGGSELTRFLGEDKRCLVLYDVDRRPISGLNPARDLGWLTDLELQVVMPIHSSDMWIGMIGLGLKVSGDRFTDSDLDLLRTMANQTAIALENASLVSDLYRLNRELQRTTLELEQANEYLRESDELKSSFIGVITHELRTPISNAIFSMQLLDRSKTGLLSIRDREEFQRLTTHVDDIREMVDNLITYAAFLRERGQLKKREFDFNAMVLEVLEPLKSLADSHGLYMTLELPAEPVILTADRDRLASAVFHLVQNAVKFTGSGGTVRARCWVADRTLLMEVQDTGVGVAEEKLDTIWGHFVQLNDPLRRGAEGLGLGLSVVKYVVEAHGGQLIFHSEEHVGSSFGFAMPLADRPPIPYTPKLIKQTFRKPQPGGSR